MSISSKEALPVQGKADTVIELVSYRSEQKCGPQTRKTIFASGLDSLQNVVYSSVWKLQYNKGTIYKAIIVLSELIKQPNQIS